MIGSSHFRECQNLIRTPINIISRNDADPKFVDVLFYYFDVIFIFILWAYFIFRTSEF